jgi:polyhydroxyalkanoate synthase subunit PhaC
MHQKSTLPTAEVTVLPIRPSVAGQGEGRPLVVPIEPQVSPLAKGADSAETYQADRALHAMLARLSAGISPAALLLAYTDAIPASTASSHPPRMMP